MCWFAWCLCDAVSLHVDWFGMYRAGLCCVCFPLKLSCVLASDVLFCGVCRVLMFLVLRACFAVFCCFSSCLFRLCCGV